MRVRAITTSALTPEELTKLRELLERTWADDADGFTEDDWRNSLGGLHLLAEEAGAIVAHASVVERELDAGGHLLRTGYVEAVATDPWWRRRGLATALMREAGEYLDRSYALGALSTGLIPFYERLGWIVWKGPTFVRTPAGLRPTPEEDGSVMVRPTPTSPELDLSAPISCDWRPGDVW